METRVSSLVRRLRFVISECQICNEEEIEATANGQGFIPTFTLDNG